MMSASIVLHKIHIEINVYFMEDGNFIFMTKRNIGLTILTEVTLKKEFIHLKLILSPDFFLLIMLLKKFFPREIALKTR